MPSPDVLDFAKLLEPIAGNSPAGIDLRAKENRTANSPYDKLKDARTAARAAERALLVPPSPTDDEHTVKAYGEAKRVALEKWPIIRNLAPQVIAEQSKDLEVAAWLIEALAREKNGYAGLRDGFRLARELCQQFWDNLYPMPDEDGLATRLAPLTGLNGDESEGTLLAPIKMVPIVQKAEDRAMTCLSFDHAHELASLDETKRNLRLQQGAVSIQMFDTAVANSSAEFFVNLLDDLKKCLDEYDALTGVLQEKCGSHAPPSSNIRNTIEGCLATVQTVAKPKLEEAGVAVADGNGAAAAGAQAGESGAVAVGAIRTREDAFRTLLQVAEYFRRNEPHTPVSYALEQVVRWGKMSLPDLLLELIPEDSPRSNLYRLVGIKPPEKS